MCNTPCFVIESSAGTDSRTCVADRQDLRHRGKNLSPSSFEVGQSGASTSSDDQLILRPQAALPGLRKEDIKVNSVYMHHKIGNVS